MSFEEAGPMSTALVTERPGRMLGQAIVCAILVAAIGCGGDRDSAARGDTAAGEVAALDYEVTPERYQRWVAAQQALDAIPGLPPPPKIDPMRFAQADIARATAYLEGDPRARAALARAGISARDYVLTTLALDQALVAAIDPAGAGGASVAAPGSSSAPGASTPARSAPGSSRPARGEGRSAPLTPPTRPRLTGTPQRNVELVRQNRGDVVRVLRTMRFRIAEPTADDLTALDTAITRSDSVAVGKDVTVKWDVTIRRKRDTTRARPSPPDSVRRDSID
jgi:hypothetical protein